jgi:hypothetical protein
MDYLVVEGYKSAAEEFSQEANIMPAVDFESIGSRMEIREALQRGDVDEAITRVNDLNPEVCGRFQRGGWKGLKSSCTTHKTLSVMRHNQTSVFNMIRPPCTTDRLFTDYSTDTRHESGTVLPPATAEDDRVHTAGTDRRGNTVCTG